MANIKKRGFIPFEPDFYFHLLLWSMVPTVRAGPHGFLCSQSIAPEGYQITLHMFTEGSSES